MLISLIIPANCALAFELSAFSRAGSVTSAASSTSALPQNTLSCLKTLWHAAQGKARLDLNTAIVYKVE